MFSLFCCFIHFIVKTWEIVRGLNEIDGFAYSDLLSGCKRISVVSRGFQNESLNYSESDTLHWYCFVLPPRNVKLYGLVSCQRPHLT